MVLLDQTSLSKRTKLYQSNQEMLLRIKERKRFLCMVTLPHERDLKALNTKREITKQNRERERPVSDMMFILVWNFRPL